MYLKWISTKKYLSIKNGQYYFFINQNFINCKNTLLITITTTGHISKNIFIKSEIYSG